ncbi:MAG: HAD-IG family 5'-nucleotidase [Candidatus Eisenbacteria bacterium]|uniref:HAD-IG family 5'-nucleotidase n=1 Tax=Eiseniibacteriota bacterium TaxID=2212470 RepID=A0A7Y2ECZ6_UNCEI|nr:HAD-IG family 5'-nucleotidase [Candidatus Eisenbacteria bacterium]
MAFSRHYSPITSEHRIPPEQRIYVNRNLRMNSVGAVGFDLDHTLAHYRGPEIEELAYRLSGRRLIERFGFPEALAKIPYERNFVIRGLVVDKKRGNILKMDYHNYVSRAYHGRRSLSDEERKNSYRTGRVRMGGKTYVSVDTLFHLPEVFLYANLIGMREEGLIPAKRTPREIYANVREAIDSVHGDGSLKTEILGNLSKYIRRNPLLTQTLEEIRSSGKKIFLLTNSEFYYTRALLSHLMDKDGEETWGRHFDYIVVDARKPGYFVDLSLPAKKSKEKLPKGFAPVVHGGNARSLENNVGFAGDQILYFGDHTYGDILRSKKNLGWRTAMVVEELEEEIAVNRQIESLVDELNDWTSRRGFIETDIAGLERQRLEAKRTGQKASTFNGMDARIQELRKDLAEIKVSMGELGDRIHNAYNPYWGSVFREGRETSRFSHQVKDFACIYMSRVTNLLNYHPNFYFRSAEERLPHENIPLLR